MQAIPAEKAGYQADKQVIRVAEAESIGIRVPNIEPGRIKRGARIGRGGEGVVYKATLSGVGEVALKCLPLAGTSEQDRAQARCPLASCIALQPHSSLDSNLQIHTCRLLCCREYNAIRSSGPYALCVLMLCACCAVALHIPLYGWLT